MNQIGIFPLIGLPDGLTVYSYHPPEGLKLVRIFSKKLLNFKPLSAKQ